MQIVSTQLPSKWSMMQTKPNMTQIRQINGCKMMITQSIAFPLIISEIRIGKQKTYKCVFNGNVFCS